MWSDSDTLEWTVRVVCTDNTDGVNTAANTDTLSAGHLWPASATNNNYVVIQHIQQASTPYAVRSQ